MEAGLAAQKSLVCTSERFISVLKEGLDSSNVAKHPKLLGLFSCSLTLLFPYRFPLSSPNTACLHFLPSLQHGFLVYTRVLYPAFSHLLSHTHLLHSHLLGIYYVLCWYTAQHLMTRQMSDWDSVISTQCLQTLRSHKNRSTKLFFCHIFICSKCCPPLALPD